MGRVRLLPHRVASPDSVEWGHWWVRLGAKRAPLEDRLKGWDYETPVTFELQPSFDQAELLRSTGIADPAAFSVVLLLDCPSVGNRFFERWRLQELTLGESNAVTISPPLGEVADHIQLSAHVVLDMPVDVPEGVAYRPGSRLASSPPLRVHLEGDSARFPTGEVSFRALGLEDAPWTLQLRFDDLTESFMGGVRLLINSDHPAAELLLDEELPGATLAQSVLRMDVARQLLLHVALDPAYGTDEVGWPEGSVGAALQAMSKLYLSSDLTPVLQLARSDLVTFERQVQSGFGLMRTS